MSRSDGREEAVNSDWLGCELLESAEGKAKKAGGFSEALPTNYPPEWRVWATNPIEVVGYCGFFRCFNRDGHDFCGRNSGMT